MNSVCLLAPAKVNLFLSVGRPDSKGFHPLRTVFQAVGLYDLVRLCIGGEKHSVKFDIDGIPEQNTVSRALEMYSLQVPIPPVSVEISKQIPSEAGLGGGSSDAAAVLRGLQRMFGSPVSEDTIHDIALRVGADVPFFLTGGAARGEGYGERLSPLPDRHQEWLVIARPSEGCPTGPMFQRLDSMEYDWMEFPATDELYNDFERVAPCASLDLIDRIQVHGASSAGLSGSGSAVFGRFSTLDLAESGAELLRSEGVPFCVVAPTLTRSESLDTWR